MVLSGAGISAESGIETFRGTEGLWEGHRIEDVATPKAFSTNPLLVHQFYNRRRSQLLSAAVSPNAAHYALARLERDFDGQVTVVTQNVDDLHERAGSKSLIHMHGELLKSCCISCGNVADCLDELSLELQCELCRRVGSLRPHIVWFGEMPLQMHTIQQRINACSLFISVGTSGHVYPAAGFALMAGDAGARTIELNLESTIASSNFDEVRQGVATKIVPELVDELLVAVRE